MRIGCRVAQYFEIGLGGLMVGWLEGFDAQRAGCVLIYMCRYAEAGKYATIPWFEGGREWVRWGGLANCLN